MGLFDMSAEVFDGITLKQTILYGYQIVFIVVCWLVIGWVIGGEK